MAIVLLQGSKELLQSLNLVPNVEGVDWWRLIKEQRNVNCYGAGYRKQEGKRQRWTLKTEDFEGTACGSSGRQWRWKLSLFLMNWRYLLFQPMQGVQCPWIQPPRVPSHTILLPPYPRFTIQSVAFRMFYLLNSEMLLFDQLRLLADLQPFLEGRQAPDSLRPWGQNMRVLSCQCKVQTSWTGPRQSVMCPGPITGCPKKSMQYASIRAPLAPVW